MTQIGDTVGEIPKVDLRLTRVNDGWGDEKRIILTQYIDGIEAGQSWLIVNGKGDVVSVRLTLLDPDQPSTDSGNWISLEQAAKEAISAVQSIPELHSYPLEPLEYKRTFYRPGDNLLAIPVYHFDYASGAWLVFVNALTGEAEVRMNGARATSDTNTLTCISINANHVRDCRNTNVLTFFGEDSVGNPVCVSDVFPVPRPPECDDSAYRRYVSTINSLETWAPMLDVNCCHKTGILIQDDVFGPIVHLDVAVASDAMPNVNYTAFWNNTKSITITYEHHDLPDGILKEIVAHEWGHAYMYGYNDMPIEMLTGSSFDFYKAYQEGFSDFIAVIWSHHSGQGTGPDWTPAHFPSRGINIPRQWSSPGSDPYASASRFSNFYYRVLNGGYDLSADRVLQLALHATRYLRPDLSGDPNVLDVKDFAAVIDSYTTSIYGSKELRKAACKAWYEMSMTDPFCVPDEVNIAVNFYGCDQAGVTWYRANWSSGGIDTDYYTLDLFTHSTGWYVDRVSTETFTYVHNNAFWEAEFRVKSCNEWACTPSQSRWVPNICGNPAPPDW